jgi:hypothetical protein
VKRTGRPRLDEHDESVHINVTVPARQYDRLWAQAQRERCSVPEVIRRQLHDDDDSPPPRHK